VLGETNLNQAQSLIILIVVKPIKRHIEVKRGLYPHEQS
jgi:hypothetical protein